MSSESTREFFEVAGRHGLLSPDSLRDLQREATTRQVDGATLVLQKGLLTALDIEIIETLRDPSAAIPGYEILAVIGRGGMGVVYRARQLALDRIVALKMVLVSHMANPTILARFENEAQTVARLVHPHIIAAFDFGRHGGRLFFAMEYVEGEDAERYIKRSYPLTERQVWLLIRQAASGLAHAAESGIVHRDIKPANLLLVAPPKGFPLPPGIPMVKIADFGLALLSADASERTRLTTEQTTLGSPHYMAPEQLKSGHIVDERADIYSLGATAFHLLAGQAPFDGQTLPQIIAQKLGENPPSLNSIRSDLSRPTVLLVEKMMSQDAGRRIGNYGELLDRIDALPMMGGSDNRNTLSTTATPQIKAVEERIRFQSWKSLTVTAIVTLIAFAVGLGTLQYYSKPSKTADTVSTLKGSGWSADLFDGKSLRGWRVQSGTWLADVDDERGTIIAGTNGEIQRLLLKPVADDHNERLSLYRLHIAVRLHDASAIELHFNFSKTGVRDVLRLTFDRMALGHRKGSQAEFEPRVPARQYEVGADRTHELRLERDLTVWRLFIDDVIAGTVPVSPQLELPEFRLVTDGGPAWFADMFVEELVESTDPE